MNKTYTVKAREHYGSDSLDITIPTDLVRKFKIKPGDIFKVEIKENEENLILTYERVYENK